jgi:hypothetical protein
MNRNLGLLAILALALSSPANAQPPNPTPVALGDKTPPNTALPAPAVSDPVPPDPAIIHDTNACSDSFHLFFFGDYLYMRPRRRAQEYAIIDPNNNGRVEGSIETLDWDWRSGFRAGGGIASPHGLEVGVFYTYLHSALTGGVLAPSGGVLFATLTHPGTVDEVASAFAATSFNYNVYDLEVGHTFTSGPSFSVRVFAGSRSARIDQNFNALYDGLTANKDFVTSRVQFDGHGARVGAEGFWESHSGLGLYGRASAALVLGDFKSHLAELNNAGTTVLVDVTDRFDKVIPVLELGFGATWRYRGLRISAGYEYTNWFGLSDLPDFVDDFHQGKLVHRISDLSIDGLTVRAELRY